MSSERSDGQADEGPTVGAALAENFIRPGEAGCAGAGTLSVVADAGDLRRPLIRSLLHDVRPCCRDLPI
jgi:hypothetical protein